MDSEFKVWLSLLGVVLVVFLVVSLCSLHFEAETYNKLTNPPVKATAWDAMWVHLRVINCKK